LQIEVDTDRDNFMNPWEAKEYGLVDVVIDDGKPGLVAPIGSRKAKKNLPSEHKILQNGYGAAQGGDGERGSEQEKQAPTPV